MKKLLTLLAAALFSISIVGCGNTNNDEGFHLSANKTEASAGDQIVFSLSGPIEGKTWGMCDFVQCYPITFTNGKYTYTVPTDVEKSVTFDFYVYTMDQTIKSNYVKIKINALPK